LISAGQRKYWCGVFSATRFPSIPQRSGIVPMNSVEVGNRGCTSASKGKQLEVDRFYTARCFLFFVQHDPCKSSESIKVQRL
jgi:hypothetical protein